MRPLQVSAFLSSPGQFSPPGPTPSGSTPLGALLQVPTSSRHATAVLQVLLAAGPPAPASGTQTRASCVTPGAPGLGQVGQSVHRIQEWKKMVQLYFPAKHHFLEGPLSHSHTASDKIIKTRSGKSSPNWCFFSHAADSESRRTLSPSQSGSAVMVFLPSH